SSGRLKPGGKTVNKPEKEKRQNGGNQRVEKAAHDAYQRADGHHGYPSDPVGQNPAEWAGEAGCNCEKCNNIPFVLGPAHVGKVARKLGYEHVETGKEQKRTGSQ